MAKISKITATNASTGVTQTYDIGIAVDTAIDSTSVNPVENKAIYNALNSKVDVESGKGLSTNDYTSAEKTKLAGIASGAEVNQNAFTTVKVGTTSLAADSKTDTLTITAGSNITLTPTASNDSFTIAATDTTYDEATTSAAGLMSASDKTKLDGIATGAEVNQNAFTTVKVGTTNLVADTKTDTLTITAGSNITLTPTASSDSFTIAATNTTYSDATTSTHGLMSTDDKTKLDGIAAGAEVNQNAFTTVKVDTTDLAADSKTDTLTITAGDHIVLTPTADNDSFSIAASYDEATTSVAGLMSSGDKSKLNGIATGAEVNQNAFTTVKVGTTNLVADTKTDTLTITAGSNITLTPTASSDSFTIAATDTTYSDATTSTHGLMSTDDKTKLDGIAAGAEVNQNAFTTVKVGTTSLVADTKTDTLTITAGSNITLTPTANSDSFTIAATNTTYNDATTSTHGLMSTDDKTKLNGIEAGAQVNQNAFTTVKVGTTDLVADSATDTLTITAGSNITLTPTASSDSFTIAATNNKVTQSNITTGQYSLLLASNNTTTAATATANKNTLLYYNIDDRILGSVMELTLVNSDDMSVHLQAGTNAEDVTIKMPSSSGTLALTSQLTDTKVTQTELSTGTRSLLLASNNTASTATDTAAKDSYLAYDVSNRMAAIPTITLTRYSDLAVNTGYLKFKRTDSTYTQILRPWAEAGTNLWLKDIEVSLPDDSGQLATIDDVSKMIDNAAITDLQAAGVEVDFENNTRTLLGYNSPTSRTNNMKCFGGRKYCYFSGRINPTMTYSTSFITSAPCWVEQPAFYYKVEPLSVGRNDDGTAYIKKGRWYVSDYALPGFKLHPAFYNKNGEPVPYIYIASCPISYCETTTGTATNSVVDYPLGSRTMTTANSCVWHRYGDQPTSNKTRDHFRAAVHGTGTFASDSYAVMTIQALSAEQLLMFIEYGNAQSNFATGITSVTDQSSYNCSALNGRNNATTSITASGSATSTYYQIGTATSATTDSASGHQSFRYRGVENLFGNIWEWIEGINIYGNGSMGGGRVYICDDFNFADDKTTDNYIYTGIQLPNSNSYCKYFAYSGAYDWLFMPGQVSGASGDQIGDQSYVTASLNGSRVVRIGGNWVSALNAGPFNFQVNNTSAQYSRNIGARMIYVPENS